MAVDESAIATIPPDPTPPTHPAGAWYPWPELIGPLTHLHAQQLALNDEHAGFQKDASHIIRETAATLDAVMAETDREFGRLRDKHRLIRELGYEEAGRMLRRIRRQAHPQPPRFHLAALAAALHKDGER